MESEKDDGFVRFRRSHSGRPLGKEATEGKTYSFFSSDITKALNKGWAPKEVFRLGIMAKEGNTAMIDRIREVEGMNAKLSAKFQKIAARNYELEEKFKLLKVSP